MNREAVDAHEAALVHASPDVAVVRQLGVAVCASVFFFVVKLLFSGCLLALARCLRAAAAATAMVVCALCQLNYVKPTQV